MAMQSRASKATQWTVNLTFGLAVSLRCTSQITAFQKAMSCLLDQRDSATGEDVVSILVAGFIGLFAITAVQALFKIAPTMRPSPAQQAVPPCVPGDDRPTEVTEK